MSQCMHCMFCQCFCLMDAVAKLCALCVCVLYRWRLCWSWSWVSSSASPSTATSSMSTSTHIYVKTRGTSCTSSFSSPAHPTAWRPMTPRPSMRTPALTPPPTVMLWWLMMMMLQKRGGQGRAEALSRDRPTLSFQFHCGNNSSWVY